MTVTDIKEPIFELGKIAEAKVADVFCKIDSIAQENTIKVMHAFQNYKVNESCFSGTTGYGYDDVGRETLDKIYAEIFRTEKALVRIGFVNGTHAIVNSLFSLCKPGETLLSITGKPYDTLRKAIGINGDEFGSLKFYGIGYKEQILDKDKIYNELKDTSIKAVLMQRSCGYDYRKTLDIDTIREFTNFVKDIRKDIYVFVDNCYGEFTETLEPTDVGVDLIAGSLIKNLGGGISPTGAYIAGKKELVDRAANRLTSPGIGGECGSTLGNNRLLFQGLFVSPHVVAQALKTAVFAASIMDELGIESYPAYDDKRSDIIQRIKLGNPEKMLKFCKGIQSGAPVDSYVSPEPWKMPGYDCDVIMADGSFIQGSSIELSADGPFEYPYNVFLQGGITYESGKLGILMAVNEMIDSI